MEKTIEERARVLIDFYLKRGQVEEANYASQIFLNRDLEEGEVLLGKRNAMDRGLLNQLKFATAHPNCPGSERLVQNKEDKMILLAGCEKRMATIKILSNEK